MIVEYLIADARDATIKDQMLNIRFLPGDRAGVWIIWYNARTRKGKCLCSCVEIPSNSRAKWTARILRPRRHGGEERQQDDEYSLFHIAGINYSVAKIR